MYFVSSGDAKLTSQRIHTDTLNVAVATVFISHIARAAYMSTNDNQLVVI